MGKCGWKPQEAPETCRYSGEQCESEGTQNVVFGQAERILVVELDDHIAAEPVIGDAGAGAEHAAFSENLRAQARIALRTVGDRQARREVIVLRG